MKRVFLIVLDSVGIGAMEDAADLAMQEPIPCVLLRREPVSTCQT